MFKVKGSLRWWTSGGIELNVKGWITVYADETKRQIQVDDNPLLQLPLSKAWIFEQHKVESENAKARVFILHGEGYHGISRIQITIPIQADTDPGKAFGLAIQKALTM